MNESYVEVHYSIWFFSLSRPLPPGPPNPIYLAHFLAETRTLA